VVLGCAALALYLATPIQRGYGDGPNLVLLFADPAGLQPVYNHALYLPLARLLSSALEWVRLELTPAETLTLYSQLSAALGLACSYLVTRALGGRRGPALLGTALFACAPPVWFYACLPEVHAPHFGAVSLVAVATLYAPWRKPVLAGALVTLLMPLLFLTHQTGLFLFPGWLLLIGLARARISTPFSARTLWLRVAPAIGLSFGLALFFNASLRQIPLEASLARSSQAVVTHNGPILEGIWTGWLQPLALLWLPLIAGLVVLATRRDRRNLALALLAVELPSVLFFCWWGVPERGGYTLGGGAFLVTLAAIGFERLSPPSRERGLAALYTPALALFLVVMQLSYARFERNLFDDPAVNAAMQERVESARTAFGSSEAPHVLVSFDATNQTITAAAPEIRELRLRVPLFRAAERGEQPRKFAENALLLVRDKSLGAELVLDRSYADFLEGDDPIVAMLLEFEALLRESYEITEFPGPGGGFWRLTAPSPLPE